MCYDEGKVQTTNCKGSENYSGKKILCLYRRAGSSPAARTITFFCFFLCMLAFLHGNLDKANEDLITHYLCYLRQYDLILMVLSLPSNQLDYN